MMSFHLTYITLLYAFVVLPIAKAQSLFHKDIKYEIATANKLMFNQKYQEAIRIFENIYVDNKIIARNIGKCYFLTKKHKKAKEWYLKANIRSVGGSANAIQHYAIILHIENQNEKAISYFGRMLKIAKEQSNLINLKDDSENAYPFYYFKKDFSLKFNKLNLSNSDSETNPAFFLDDAVLYLSSKQMPSNMSLVQKKDVNFLTRITSVDTDSKSQKQIPLNLKDIKGLCDIAFYNNGNSAIITKKIKISDNVKKDKLKRKIANPDFVTQLFNVHLNKSSKQWSKLQPINELNSSYYSIGQVGITPDGKYMVYSSDQYGGYGSTDLYETKFVEGKWNKPKNLGSKVNTIGSEMYPFIYASNIFYASNYKSTLDDDLDIFRVRKYDNEYIREPLEALNTESDDFGLIFKKSLSQSYLVSNRDGNNDIYKVNFSLINKVDVTLDFIDNKSGSRVNDVQIKIYDENYNYITSFVTGARNKVELSKGKVYFFETYKEGYFFNKNKIKVESKVTDNHYVYKLYNEQMYHGFVGNRDNQIPISYASITIENLNTRKKQFAMTTEKGHYKFIVEPLTAYKLLIRKNEITLSDTFFTGKDAQSIANNYLTTSMLSEDNILAMKKTYKNMLATIDNDTIPENIVAPKSTQKKLKRIKNTNPYKNKKNVTSRAIYNDGKRVYTPKTSSLEEIQEHFGYNPNVGLMGAMYHKANGIKALNLSDELISEIKSKMIGDNVSSNLVLKIISSTEAKGNKAENTKKSDRRAIYLRNKFFLQGIPMAKIMAIGVGESVLQNECHRSNKCAEKEHALNRGTRIYIQPY